MKYKTLKELLVRNTRFYLYSALKRKRYSVEDSIVIFSEPRGGSTWLMEIFNHMPNTAVNWEPFHDKLGVVPPDLEWTARPFWEATEKLESNKEIIKSILEFSLFNSWTLAISDLKQLLKADIIITKFVRANLLLPWMVNTFNFKNKPILLIRNPIDACVSQMQSFGKLEKDKVNYLFEKRFPEHSDFMKSLDSEMEIRIGLWCLNNLYTLNYPNIGNDITTIFYEDLLVTPSSITTDVFEKLDISQVDKNRALEAVEFRKASAMNVGGLKSNPETQLMKNIDKLDDSEKQKIQAVYDYFNFDLYQANSPWKNMESSIYKNLI